MFLLLREFCSRFVGAKFSLTSYRVLIHLVSLHSLLLYLPCSICFDFIFLAGGSPQMSGDRCYQFLFYRDTKKPVETYVSGVWGLIIGENSCAVVAW